jgi:tRNA threonylcarbamoyladenosine biosynthesis protein TsaB
VELAIDSAADEVGIALSVDGVVGLMAAWTTERRHSVELLPNIDRLLAEAGRPKADLTAIVVDIGPGSYAGLRVGVSIAKALAHGLGVPVAGVGRLELDAYGVAAEADGRRIVAVHRAGRGEVAWAAYRASRDEWLEEAAPRIGKAALVRDFIAADDAVTGDLDDELMAALFERGAFVASAKAHRVVALAALGALRLAAGRTDDPRALVPLYLREPAIGPQN